jgi:cephalosporin hydroxylase
MQHKAKRLIWVLRNLVAGFSEAREAKRPGKSWEAIFDFIRTFDYGSHKPMQDPTEAIAMMEAVEEMRPRTVLEIGTAWGGTLFLLSRAAASDALLISVDLPGGKFGGELVKFHSIRRWILKRIVLPGQALRFVRADSHKEETLKTVKRLLKARPLEILFIDADHSYDGVKRDFEMYSPLVAAGGLVIFHDIADFGPGYGVKRFWEEVKTGHRFEEIVDPLNFDGKYTDRPCGVGILHL